MSVYVDPMMACVPNRNWRWRENCHLTADTDEELHAFAQSIGLRRSWHQRGSISHYDLTRGKRALAVRRGAIELTRKQAAERYRAVWQRAADVREAAAQAILD